VTTTGDIPEVRRVAKLQVSWSGVTSLVRSRRTGVYLSVTEEDTIGIRTQRRVCRSPSHATEKSNNL